MSLAGQEVGFGMVQGREFLQRMDFASKIFYRIVERRRGEDFRTCGRRKNAVKEDGEIFLSVPRAASFAVTLKLGRPAEQTRLPGFSDTTEVLDEFMTLMDSFSHGDFGRIAKVIPGVHYRKNFVQLAKKIAPDGENVTVVGFTTMQKGNERIVAVSRRRKDIVIPKTVTANAGPRPKMVSVRGILHFADATDASSGRIKIVDEQAGRTHAVDVPEEMMNDIVKPLWGCYVVIKGTKSGRTIKLEEIEED